MADYITGDQGSVTITGTGAPTNADVARWALRIVRPRENQTPFGVAFTKYKMTRPTGDGFFDVMLPDTGAAHPVIPNNVSLAAVFTAMAGTIYTFSLKVESQQVVSDSIGGRTLFLHCTFVLDSLVT